MTQINRIKRTKILATIGPAVDDPEILEKIIRAGVNACRMNFSHGNEQERLNEIKYIREISARIGRNVAILQDLQGPKIRLGHLKDEMRYDIKRDDVFGLTYGIEHDGGNNLPSQYDLSDKCDVGDAIYLFDGKIKTIVQSIEGKTVWVKAMNDGFVISNKAINLPDMKGKSIPVLTDKDLADLEWGLNQDIDYTALSFVHTAADVEYLRSIIKSKGSDRPIIVKLETKTAADPANLESIVKAADGVMVARGDLAVEAGAEIVPVIERRIIELCQRYCKLCIVATQMLGSMVDNPEPTRAEVNDVATAAIEGADAVMLSDETAMGKYPVEAVTVMNKVLQYTQQHQSVYNLYERCGSDPQRNGIGKAAVNLANSDNADAIVVETRGCNMARNIAVQRPNQAIIAVAHNQRAANRASLIYNTQSFVGARGDGEKVARQLVEDGFFGKSCARVVLVRQTADDAPSADTIQLLDICK